VRGRRAFVGTSLALAGVAAGTITGLSTASAQGEEHTRPQPGTVGFGWEVTNLDNNGADVYFHVRNAMTLNSVNIDAAFMITSPPANPGFAEVLCRAAVSRGAAKFVQGDPAAPLVPTESPHFGKVQIYNPNNLGVGADGFLLQDVFYHVILKTWVPAEGTASATSRHVSAAPLLSLQADDYLAFHMDHAGVPGDAEMQVVLNYTLT
jgi:hypothetical protein